MRTLQFIFTALAFGLYLPALQAQIESTDELEFEASSIMSPYKPSGKNYAFIRSKRGKGGVAQTETADSISTLTINEIVLVYTEMNEAARESRDAANKERWENLLKTYPEFFGYASTYKNICQCNPNGDSTAFKKAQGFYVYYESDEAAAPAPEPVAEVKKPVKEEPKAPAKQQETAKQEKAEAAPEKKKPAEEKNNKAVEVAAPAAGAAAAAVGAATSKPKEEPKETVKEPVKETEPVEEAAPVAKAKPTASAAGKKKNVPKVRRAKDKKACRPACFGYGDEDLGNFFQENIPLTKKQRRKAKKWTAMLNLQIATDGSLTKYTVTGQNEDFNQMVQEAASKMQSWNAAVKNGVTIKSQVKITLKYDKASKSIKPSDVMYNPKPSPKCPCVSDAELFGD